MPPRGGKRPTPTPVFVEVKEEPEIKNESDDTVALPFHVGDRCKQVWDAAVTRMSHFDLSLVCGVPNNQKVIRCHQAVLSSASENLATLLQGRAVQSRDGSWVTSHVTMFLPDVKPGDMVRLLCLLYNGFAQVKDAEEAKELKDLTKELGLTIVKLNKKDNRISIVPGTEFVAGLSLSGHHFLGSGKGDSLVSLEETVAGGGREDSDEDPDDPQPLSRLSGRAQQRGPASKRRPGPGGLTSPSKKVKTELPFIPSFKAVVEEVHTCGICHGKTKEGKTDKEASNLSFKPTGFKRLLDHYSKHLYEEGLIQKQVPWGENNTNPDTGSVKDEFGQDFRYSCKVPNCWMLKKPAVGYKAFALHNSTDHGALEAVLDGETRPVLVNLYGRIKKVRAAEAEANKPRRCVIPGCPDSGKRMHENIGDWASLKKHYIANHFMHWFRAASPDDELLRTQPVTEGARATVCTLCRAKMVGGEVQIAEHYGVVHDRLHNAVKEDEGDDARIVRQQMYSQRE